MSDAIHAEFGGSDFAHRDCASRAQASDENRIMALGRIVLVEQRTIAARHAGAAFRNVLHAERHTRERARIFATPDPEIHFLGLTTSALRIEMHEGIDAIVLALDLLQCTHPRWLSL